jgi:acyl carrier protein
VTANAVIQRCHLPLLGAYVEPRSQTERALAEIWRRAFGMDCVGITDSYEDLGGDSLVAASIFAELEVNLGIKIPWASLVEARTIEQLAAVVDDLQRRMK